MSDGQDLHVLTTPAGQRCSLVVRGERRKAVCRIEGPWPIEYLAGGRLGLRADIADWLRETVESKCGVSTPVSIRVFVVTAPAPWMALVVEGGA